MAIEVSRTVEVTASPLKMAGLSAASVALTILSGTIAFRVLPGIRAGSFVEFAGYAGLPFFGLCTSILIWRLLIMRGPVVVMNSQGIRDARVASEFIPWTAVREISTWQAHGQKVMVLAIDPAVEKQLSLTRIARWSRGANRSLGADGLCVTAQGLRIDYETLLSTSMSFWRGSSAKG